MTPRLLDLFCGQGGAGMGYHLAGFDVTGVDIALQPRYPFAFVQADALEYAAAHGCEYDVIHASPPCQGYSQCMYLPVAHKPHLMLIEPTRAELASSGRPYVIENVEGAPLLEPLMLCGSMFGLGVLRHRLFECNPRLAFAPSMCNHTGGVLPIWWRTRQRVIAAGMEYKYLTVAGKSYLMPEAKRAMDIDWMSRPGMSQAIPPAYTRWIGEQLREVLGL